MTTYIGYDGCTYAYVDKVLTITGEGAGGAMYEGVLYGPEGYHENVVADFTDMVECIVGEGLTRIPSLSGCHHLKRITLPSTITATSIDSYTFTWCASLEELVIPSSVTSIASSAFNGCSRLHRVVLPASMQSIGGYAFSSCYNLFEVVNLSSLSLTLEGTDNGYVARFAKVLQTSASQTAIATENGFIYGVANGTTYLLGQAGADTIVTLPDTLNGGTYEIYGGAFSNDYDLTSVVISAGVTAMTANPSTNQAFVNCHSLREVINLSSLQITAGSSGNGYVAYYAMAVYAQTSSRTAEVVGGKFVFETFSGEPYLVRYLGNETTVTTPSAYNNSQYTVPAYAFAYRFSPGELIFSDGVKKIEDSAVVDYSKLQTITIGANCTDISPTIVNTTGSVLKRFSVDDSNTAYTAVDGILYTKDLSTVVKCPVRIELTELTLSSPTTAISDRAFMEVSTLKSVTLSSSVATAGYRAFYQSRIESLRIENASFTGGNMAFGYMSGLKSLTVPAGLDTVQRVTSGATMFYMFDRCTAIENVRLIKGTGTGAACDYHANTGTMRYYGCTPWYYSRSNLKTIVIESGVTSVGEHMFRSCASSSPLAITIGDTVATIGQYAFYDCYNTGTLIFNCTSTDGANMTINSKGFEFRNSAHAKPAIRTFSNDNWAASRISASNTTFSFNTITLWGICGDGAVWTLNSGVLTVEGQGPMYDISQSMSYLPYRDQVTSVVTTGNITSIGEGCFESFSNLTAVTTAVPTIGRAAFMWCFALETVTINSGTVTIDEAAFDSCNSLTTVTLPSTLITISDVVFMGCSSLTSITLPSGLKTIGGHAFSHSGVTSFTLPSTVSSIGVGAFETDAVTSISVNNSNYYYSADSGILFDKNKTKLVYYPAYKDGTSYTVPSTVRELGAHAFYSAHNLTSISLNQNLTTIGDYAFAYTKIKKIILPASVTSLGDSIFAYISPDGGDTFSIIFRGTTAPAYTQDTFDLSNLSDKTANVYSSNNWAENVLPEHPNEYSTLVFFDLPPSMKVKVNGSWVIGTPMICTWYLSNSEMGTYTNDQLSNRTQGDLSTVWKTAKAVYIKVNGVWVESEREI